jgi:cation:H+ antiporter
VSPVVSIAGGLILLMAGGDLLVRGAVRLAVRLGISTLVVGLTVVAFGTSAPELAVSLQAVGAGAGELALGNVVGSNIFNVLFILGISTLIAPLAVSRRVVWVEVPIMVGFSLLAAGLAADGRVGAWDGGALLALVVVYTVWLVRAGTGGEALEHVGAAHAPGGAGGGVLMVVMGLGLLVAGARWLVAGAVDLAAAMGVSDEVVGLTIVAAGTSLPEVAASIAASVRGQREIAVGNVVGSNIFNLTVILGTTAVAGRGLTVSPGMLSFDFVVMVAVAVACLPIFVTGHSIDRWEGGLFLGYYAAYTVYLVLDATEHPLFPHFVDAMALFALPLTAVTLGVLASHAWLRKRERSAGL